MSKWPLTPVSDMCEVILGQSPPGESYNQRGEGLPFFQGKAEFGPMYPTAVKWCSAPSKIALPNDVLLSVRAPVGPTNLAREECCIGRGLAALRAKSGVLPKFVLYGMRSTHHELASKATGSTFSAVSGAIVRQHLLPFPTLDEQRVIVEAIETQFARLDDAVAALERTRTRLKRYRASVLKAACEGRLVPTEVELARQEGRQYEPASVLLERIKAERDAAPSRKRGRRCQADMESAPTEDRGPLPEGWAWTTLPEIGELARGKSKHRPRNDPQLMNGPYPFVQTAEVRQSGGKIREYERTYSEFGLAQSRLWPTGTLCITIAANIAESGILTFPACFPDSVVGFVIEPVAGIPEFYDAYLRTVRTDIERLAPATAQKNINLDTLFKLRVPLPPVREQHRIVDELERISTLIDQMDVAVETSLKRAKSLRQAILRQAFAGQLTRMGAELHV